MPSNYQIIHMMIKLRPFSQSVGQNHYEAINIIIMIARQYYIPHYVASVAGCRPLLRLFCCFTAASLPIESRKLLTLDGLLDNLDG